MSDKEFYQSPLAERYASSEMLRLFSPDYKYSTWRSLWCALAEAESELGLPIGKEQIQELKAHTQDINYESVSKYEKILHHDVVAHLRAYGDLCPKAKGIIHLGATSTFLTDNTDTIQMREGLRLLSEKLSSIIKKLKEFAETYADTPCLSYTHLQPAQLTTIGKRACMWLQDFLIDFKEINFRKAHLKFLGVKGATGTQASFLALFGGDVSKVQELDRKVAKKMGFSEIFSITSQTYPRKQDVTVLDALKGIAISSHKFGTDIRLLAGFKEIEESFDKTQVGSSAMPYKRNPILSERVCGIARFIISLSENGAYNAATQWLERSLDDSANRRMVIPEAFLSADAILNLLSQIVSGLEVNRKVIARRIAEELPFMATENIMMASVKKGQEREIIHEKLRQHSLESWKDVKEDGKANRLLDRIADDPSFNLTKEELHKILDVNSFIGRAPDQVREFIKEEFGNGGRI